MNRNILITAVAAGLLAVPASYAAIDDAGMQYTSAAEGFYGSLRTGFFSTETETNGVDSETVNIDAVASRLGIRGSVDLGGGLSASYRYEFGVNGDEGSNVGNTRLHNVGLSGGFGSLVFGTQWALDYNTVWVTTDVMNQYSGWYVYNANRAGRQSNAATYYSPDFNGFNFGIGVVADAESERAATSGGGALTAATATGTKSDTTRSTTVFNGVDGVNCAQVGTYEADETCYSVTHTDAVTAKNEEADGLDKIVLAASYSLKGFNIGGTYVKRSVTTVDAADVKTSRDPKTYGVALGYGQDNWSLGYYYASTDLDVDTSGDKSDEKVHSLAGQVSIGKTTLRALYETRTDEIKGSNTDLDNEFWTLEAQYDLGSKSRVYVEYSKEENDANDYEASRFLLGHRVDF